MKFQMFFAHRPKRRTQVFLLLLLVVLITAACLIFVEGQRKRIDSLPSPTGPYAVGRMEYDWTDQARVDPLATRPGTKRELVVWAWYPAERVAGSKAAPYLPLKWQQLSDQQHGSTVSVQTHSLDGAPLIAEGGRLPVLIFAPGMGNIPNEYTALLEDLASHGYVIFAVTPTDSANVVVFPDGRVVQSTAAGKLEDVESSRTNQLLGIWAQDEIFTIDQLSRLNTTPGNLWSQRLDLSRLGFFGHSFGGATAAQVCHLDERCGAGIDLDGALAGGVVKTGLDKPFMVISHDMGSCSDSECQAFQHDIHAVLRAAPMGSGYDLSIQGTEHFNFSDFAVRSMQQNLRFLGVLGAIDGARGLEITRAYVRTFFDVYLRQQPSSLLSGLSRSYPEVHQFSP